MIKYCSLILLIGFVNVHAQDTEAEANKKRDQVIGGIFYGYALGNYILNKNVYGFELGGLRKKNENYSIGFSADFMFTSTRSHDVHIPNNLMTGESLEPFLVLFGLTTVHHVDLNPESKVKLFIEGKAGLRLANYSVTHYGYLLFVKTEDKMYSDTSFGLCLGLLSGIYIPLKADSRYGLRIKTGLHTGTPIKY